MKKIMFSLILVGFVAGCSSTMQFAQVNSETNKAFPNSPVSDEVTMHQVFGQ
ncbi:hypothetical protein [Vibrio mexicanus]|uniref:hypothetical protein n=1 Tax=Vibrio mexicanus TaxID=1004326 RepID=UPI000A9BA2F9|nr:hypothetical protein [Vibrio mexicanus]